MMKTGGDVRCSGGARCLPGVVAIRMFFAEIPMPREQGVPVSLTASDPALLAEIRQSLDATKRLGLACTRSGPNNRESRQLAGYTSADVDVRANPLAKGVCTLPTTSRVSRFATRRQHPVKLFDDWSNLGSISELSTSRVLDPAAGVTQLLSGVTNLQAQRYRK